MKIKSFVKKATAASLAAALVSVFALTVHSSAVPYDPNNPGTNYPAFNIYTGTPSVGDEPDFLRGKEETSTGYVNDVNSACKDGARYSLRVYVHNGANEIYNEGGNGPGVAHDAAVRVSLPDSQTAASNFPISSVVSARNASSVSDSMSIDCGGKKVKLNYVAGTAKQFTALSGTQALSDSIVTTGAPIGTYGPNGDVWGCWDQRVWVTLVVEVKEEVTPPPVTATCDLMQITATADRRKVTISNFKTSQTNASVKNVVINWGDNTPALTLTDASKVVGQMHEYSADGTYNITATVTFSVEGKPDVTAGGAGTACAQQVKFTTGQPPVVKPPVTSVGSTVSGVAGGAGPTQLVSTGAGSTIGAFLAATAAGVVGYRRFLSRKLGLDS